MNVWPKRTERSTDRRSNFRPCIRLPTEASVTPEVGCGAWRCTVERTRSLLIRFSPFEKRCLASTAHRTTRDHRGQGCPGRYGYGLEERGYIHNNLDVKIQVYASFVCHMSNYPRDWILDDMHCELLQKLKGGRGVGSGFVDDR